MRSSSLASSTKLTTAWATSAFFLRTRPRVFLACPLSLLGAAFLGPLPRRGSRLPSPIKTSCGQWLLRHPLHIRLFGRRSVACHADVWAVATCNGAALCTAWAGINYVLEAAPKVASPDAAHAPGTIALLYVLAGNVVLVANRQLYHQFHSRMDLSASHVLEYE